MTVKLNTERVLTLPFKIGHLFFITLFLFALGSSLNSGFGAVVQGLSFIPLFGYFPGHYLNLSLFRKKYPLFTDISFSLVSSLAVIILGLVVLKSSMPLQAEYLTFFLVALNLGIYILFKLSQILLRNKEIEIPIPVTYTLSNWVLVSLPLVFFAINVFLNPIISEGDSYYFINAARDSFTAGSDISPYVTRPGFIPLLGLLNLAGGLSFLIIFKLLLPLLFYVSTWTLIDVIKEKSAQPEFSQWLYLLFLAAPVIGSEVDIARPQSIAFAFTVPALLLLSQFLEMKSWRHLAVVALYVFSLSLIHELAYLLAVVLIASLVVFFVAGFKHASNKAVWLIKQGKNLALALVILLPYWMLFNGAEHFGLVIHSARTTISHILSPDWNWWFLDNYETDGNAVGWKGIEALKYYLYNGLFLVIPLALLYFGQRYKKLSVTVVPFLLYFLLFFSIAELLPRLGLYFYPNRAWPHMLIGLWVFVLFLSFTSIARSNTWGKVLKIAITGTALAGVVGWCLVTTSKGGFYSTKDKNILEYIKTSLPSDAIIYSNQSASQVIIPYFTDKHSGYLYYEDPWKSITDIQTSLDVFDKELQQKNRLDSLPIYQTTILSYGVDDVIVSKQLKLIEGPRKPKVTYDPNRPGYLYYSFSRLEGVFGSREWWRAANGYDTLELFKNVDSENIVYRDDSGVILKIR